MAQKKKSKAKTLGKKDLKKTKGGLNFTISAAPANDPSNRLSIQAPANDPSNRISIQGN